jgi:hypothetical protein
VDGAQDQTMSGRRDARGRPAAETSAVWLLEMMRQDVAMLSCQRRGKDVRSGRGREESRRQGNAMWGLGQQVGGDGRYVGWGGPPASWRCGRDPSASRRCKGGPPASRRCGGGPVQRAGMGEGRPMRGNRGPTTARVNLWAVSHKWEHQGVDIS